MRTWRIAEQALPAANEAGVRWCKAFSQQGRLAEEVRSANDVASGKAGERARRCSGLDARRPRWWLPTSIHKQQFKCTDGARAVRRDSRHQPRATCRHAQATFEGWPGPRMSAMPMAGGHGRYRQRRLPGPCAVSEPGRRLGGDIDTTVRVRRQRAVDDNTDAHHQQPAAVTRESRPHRRDKHQPGAGDTDFRAVGAAKQGAGASAAVPPMLRHANAARRQALRSLL